MSRPKPLVFPAKEKHTATVIFCHGLGDTAAGWADVVQMWTHGGKMKHIKFILPNAKTIPITGNGGYPQTGWYDITSFSDLDAKSDDGPGITGSRDYLIDLIKEEEKSTGVPSSRVILGGFSQGGAMSLFTGFTSPIKLGGIVGLSSYMLMLKEAPELMPKDKPNADTPFFMGHGAEDPLVRHKWGQQTADKLKEWGFKVDFNTYSPLPHSVNNKEIEQVEAFIREQLPVTDQTASKA